MAVAPNTNINIPYSPFLNEQTGRPNTEWLQWLMNPSFITLNLGSALPVTSGGTGLTTIPTNGQLLIGNGTGYTLNPLTPGVGIGVTNGAGLITVANTGVLSNIAGTGISVSNPTGNVTIGNTGVLSWSGGSTGLTPATATTGVVTLAGTLGAGYGGTGLNTYVIGDLLYASGTTAFSRLADIATGNALISGGIATAPSWGKIGLTTHVSGTLPIGNGGTNGTATATAGAVAYGTGTAYSFTAAGTLGQVLTSAGAGTPTWATPTTGTVTAVSVVSANGLAGTSSGGATPALTLSTTITGLLKGNGTAISAAASGTDYAPATSGTSILYGNGSGGFSNVTIGTGVAFAGGTLSATGSGGTVTSVTGTAPVVSSGGATPAISMAAATTSVNGYLTSTDWTTFNNKGSGTVTSVGGTGTVNGITLTGTVTSSGNLTLGGTLSGVSLTTQVSGILPIVNGGTNASTASITSFNNITGYSASGATGTTSTNLVFSTSPTLTTPTLGAALATSIKFGSGTVLSTYEEGTWTPNANSGWTDVGTVTRTGTYTKIGRQVFITVKIAASGGGSVSMSAANISNLPFTAANAAVGGWGVVSNYGGATQTQNVLVDGAVMYFTGSWVGVANYVYTASATYTV